MPVLEYKCSGCGSSMGFDSQSGMLRCESCGRQEDIASIPDPLKKSTFTQDEVKEYHCNSCGAVLLTEAETTATSCSFCGSNVVLGDRLTGRLAPAMIIPFAISKQEAIQAFRKWCKNGRFAPDDFMTADRIQSMTGIYVPFWLYDLNNNVEVHARGTKVKTYIRGEYQITETKHYMVYRQLQLNYVKVPIDAAEKMNDELMDKLEPFPYDQLQSFKTPYLAGYIAEKYSYDDNQLLPRAKHKIESYINEAIQSSIKGYTTVTYTNKQVNTRVKQAQYVMLPVWAVHYHYKGKTYTFAMNGQTGKVVGKPPISKTKVAAWFGSLSVISLLSLKLISWMMGGEFW